MITIEDVKEKVEAINEMRCGAKATTMETNLYKDVLEAILKGFENPQELIAEALKAQNIDFTQKFW